jgi:hypothetical protein
VASLVAVQSARSKNRKRRFLAEKRLSSRFFNSDSDYIRERNKVNALATFVVLETSAAVDGAIVSRLERDLGGRSALGANRIKHFAVTATSGLAARAALFATDGFVLETLLSIELLLAGRKDEILTAILAYQCLVFEHLDFFPFSVHEISDIRVPADLVFAPTPADWKGRSRRCASHYCLSRSAKQMCFGWTYF